MSSTLFTASPHWRWLILAYFFLGGLAAGSYFLTTLLDLFGKGRDRRLVHLGYLIAFPLVCVCGLVLTVDLGRPKRFWHILVQSEALRPMLKVYSPMSTGAWALLLFGGCAFLSFVAVLAEGRRRRGAISSELRPTAFCGGLRCQNADARGGAGPPRWAAPPRRHHLFFAPAHMMQRWRSIVLLLLAGAALGCTSPESTRARGGEAGADVGNHARGAVQIHAGAGMYYGTRTHGDGIGQRAFIGGTETVER